MHCSFKLGEWKESVAKINTDLNTLYQASFTHFLPLNPNKSQVLVFGSKKTYRSLIVSTVIDIRRTPTYR